ncbi:hypothetical protein BGX27_003031 [Mortierella sp. AM989]|nr:hypothetical protein BGX27_003031 [Mortierella sp. AM989]
MDDKQFSDLFEQYDFTGAGDGAEDIEWHLNNFPSSNPDWDQSLLDLLPSSSSFGAFLEPFAATADHNLNNLPFLQENSEIFSPGIPTIGGSSIPGLMGNQDAANFSIIDEDLLIGVDDNGIVGLNPIQSDCIDTIAASTTLSGTSTEFAHSLTQVLESDFPQQQHEFLEIAVSIPSSSRTINPAFLSHTATQAHRSDASLSNSALDLCGDSSVRTFEFSSRLLYRKGKRIQEPFKQCAFATQFSEERVDARTR